MKDVRVAEIPPCSIELMLGDEPRPGLYDSPLKTESQALFGASWADLCEEHFEEHGLDTSVTVRRVVL